MCQSVVKLFLIILNCVFKTATKQSPNVSIVPRSIIPTKINWCALNCPNELNIACKYKGKCHLNEPCTRVKLDPYEILDIHNNFRNEFSAGRHPKASQVLVADMLYLNWNDDLAFLASCNLKPCSDNVSYDSCHKTVNFLSAGQNIASTVTTRNCLLESYNVLRKWYEESNKLTEKEILSMAKAYYPKKNTKHFSQMVWSRTHFVGCVAVSKSTGKGMLCQLVCNYAPSGNILGQYVFQEGQPCSKCPEELYANRNYPGLCGRETNSSFANLGLVLIFLGIIVFL